MAYPESLRDRLPRSETYPLRRTHLDAALTAAGVEAVTLVYFLRGGIDEWLASRVGRVLGVEYKAARSDRRESTEVRVHAVPKERNHLVAEALVPDQLGRVVAWIRAAETADNVWRSQDHRLLLRWDGEALTFQEH
jgi:hypothetical protein